MSSHQNYVLSVDVGTSVVRVSAVSLSGEVLVTVRAPGHPRLVDDTAELDAETLSADVSRLVREVAEQAGQPLAVGVACQLGMVLVDDALAPLGPALLWQDRRASAEADELSHILGGRAGAIAGRRVAPELTAPRLRWVARHQSDIWRQTRWVLSLKDFLVARLTGRIATDPTSASYTLLFDIVERTWSPELLAAAEVPGERVPVVSGAHEPCGAITAEVANATGLRPGIPVAVGGPDGSVAALASGAVQPRVAVDIAGTTDVLLYVCDRPIVDPQQRSILNAYLVPGLWTIGGPTGVTGGAIAWLAHVLGFGSVEQAYRELGESSARIAPGAAGVAFHTALTGERFPNWAGQRAGSISGLRPEHTGAHLVRAAEEGAAFAVREGLDALATLGVDIGEVRISGGVTKRRAAMQLRANVWGKSVVGVANPEASTVGAAMLAAVCAGAYHNVEVAAAAMVHLDAPVEPEPAATQAYQGAFKHWQAAR